MKIFQLTDLNMNGALTGGNCTKSPIRSEEHTSELQSQSNLVCRLLLETQNSLCEKIHTDHSSIPAHVTTSCILLQHSSPSFLQILSDQRTDSDESAIK